MKYTFTIEPTCEDDPQDTVTVERETEWDDLYFVSDYLLRCLHSIGFTYIEDVVLVKEGGKKVSASGL